MPSAQALRAAADVIENLSAMQAIITPGQGRWNADQLRAFAEDREAEEELRRALVDAVTGAIAGYVEHRTEGSLRERELASYLLDRFTITPLEEQCPF